MPAKKRVMPKFTKAPESMVARFNSATSKLAGIETRTMFSYPAAFINGNMFSSLFQSNMILKLSEADRAACAREFGAQPFAPMPGRAMGQYVVVPEAILQSPSLLDAWLRKSYRYAAALPPKRAAKAKTSTKKAKVGSRKQARSR
jgi:TfoX/Sxy family transcriptional regulator of competence genes